MELRATHGQTSVMGPNVCSVVLTCSQLRHMLVPRVYFQCTDETLHEDSQLDAQGRYRTA